MNKKDILFPFVFLAIGGFFLFVSAMVFFSKGKSQKWVLRKMKIGGLLLALTSFQNTGFAQRVTCYEQVAINDIRIEAEYNNGYIINLKQGNLLKGSVSESHSVNYSFAITNKVGKIIQQGRIEPADGKFDNRNEDFSLKLDNKLTEGKYILKLYSCPVNEQDPKNPDKQFDLWVKNE
jgi:hypothetical protein